MWPSQFLFWTRGFPLVWGVGRVGVVACRALFSRFESLRLLAPVGKTGSLDTSAAPTAFISWAHSEPGWDLAEVEGRRDAVARLAAVLREQGIDADVDLYHLHRSVDWTRWGPERISVVDYVLVVLSPAWRRAWEGSADPATGAGAAAEADVLRSIYVGDRSAFIRKVRLIGLPDMSSVADIPNGLHGVPRHLVTSLDEVGMRELIRDLTNQPYWVKPPLGRIPTLPTALTTNVEPHEAHLSPPPQARNSVDDDEEYDRLVAILSALPAPELGEGPHLPWYREWERVQTRLHELELRRGHQAGGSTSGSTPPSESLGGSIPGAHDVERRAMTALRAALPSDWVFRSVGYDAGFDGEVEVVDAAHQLTGRLFRVELKAIQSVPSSSYLRVQLTLSQYRRFLALETPMLVVLYDAHSSLLYARWLHDIAISPSKLTNLSISVYFDAEHLWTSDTPRRLCADLDSYRARLSKASDSLLRGLTDRLENFITLLDQRPAEESIQAFLAANPILLQPDAVTIIPKFRLGSEYVSDFVIELAEHRYVFVELEAPSRPLFTKRRDPTSELSHAQKQVEDWLQWLDENISYARSRLNGLLAPQGLIVIGRSGALDATAVKMLHRRNAELHRISVITYDDLISRTKAFIQNLRSLSD